MAAKTPVARTRRTKAAVQQEFEGIRREALAEHEAAQPRAEEAERAREAEVRQSAAGATVDQIAMEQARTRPSQG